MSQHDSYCGLNADETSSSKAKSPAEFVENPFDYAFTQWANNFKPQIRQQVIGEPLALSSREAPKSRLAAMQSGGAEQQIEEARTIIQALER